LTVFILFVSEDSLIRLPGSTDKIAGDKEGVDDLGLSEKFILARVKESPRRPFVHVALDVAALKVQLKPAALLSGRIEAI